MDGWSARLLSCAKVKWWKPKTKMDCEWSGWGWKEEWREAWLMAGLWGKLPTECLYPVPPLYKTLALLWRSESAIINAFPVCWPSKMHSSKPCDHLYPSGSQHGACISHKRYIVALRFWSGCCNKILYAALSVLEAVGILFPSSLNVLLCCVFGNKSDSWNFLVHWFANTMLRTLQHPETCPDYWFPSPLLSRSWQACGAQQQEVGATYSSLGHSQLVSCKFICNSVARIDMCRTYVIFQSSFIFNHREDHGILYHPNSDIQVSCRNVDFSHLQEDDTVLVSLIHWSTASVTLTVYVCVLYYIFNLDMRFSRDE